MKLINLFKKQKTRFITKELVSLSSLAQVPSLDYFKDNNQILLLINLFKKEYLEILIKEKVLTSNELKAKELHNKLKMIHTLIEQNTLGDELFEKVIFNEEDKVKALIKLRKFAIYNEQIKDLEEEIVSRIIALKEILKKTFLNKQKRMSIINEVNNLTNIFVVLINQKETLRLCLNNYGLKCFDITKEKDLEKEEKLIKERKEELNAYQMQAFGKIVYEINDLNDMAKTEVALEDYVYNSNKNVKNLREELNNINSLEEIEKLEKKYYLYYEFGKNIIDTEDFQKLYRLKFKYFTTWRYEYKYNVPILIETFITEKTSKLELETYEERVFELINDITTNRHSFLSIEWMFGENYLKVIGLLKKELQTNGKYNTLEILNSKYKLNLLIAFSYPVDSRVITNFYKLIYVKKSDYPEVNFYEPEFIWDEYLPLETVNELKLIQNQKKDISLYLFLKKCYRSLDDLRGIYRLPEGLKEVGSFSMFDNNNNNNNDRQTLVKTDEYWKFIENIRQNMKNKVVIFPKTLKKELGNLIGDIELRELQLNEGLEFFLFNPNGKIKKISMPSTIVCFEMMIKKQADTKLETIHFHDFDKSRFYDNVENLKKFLMPYIEVTEDEIGNEKIYRYKLTINRIIFDFGNEDYPERIILKKDQCKICLGKYSIEEGMYYLAKHINYLIMQEIAAYRGIHTWQLIKD